MVLLSLPGDLEECMNITCYNGIHSDITDKIIRAAIEVHRELKIRLSLS